MSRIFWDTHVFLYLFEDFGALSALVEQLRSKMIDRGDQLLTSALTLGEILAKPTELRDSEFCRRYESAITLAATVIAFDGKAAKVYARLRSDRSLKPLDAFQLACAASAEVDLFVADDERFQQTHVEGIDFIVPLRRVSI